MTAKIHYTNECQIGLWLSMKKIELDNSTKKMLETNYTHTTWKTMTCSLVDHGSDALDDQTGMWRIRTKNKCLIQRSQIKTPRISRAWTTKMCQKNPQIVSSWQHNRAKTGVSVLKEKFKWPLFKFLGVWFENDALGYNSGILITKSLIVQILLPQTWDLIHGCSKGNRTFNIFCNDKSYYYGNKSWPP